MIVVVYDAAETTRIPLPVRASWIEQLYPGVEVILAWDGPTEVSDDPAVTQQHDAYLKSLLADKGVTHFFSSEFYGDHVSRALRAADRRVDSDRTSFPVSGAMVRSDPYRYRQHVEPIVYRDLITKVVFLGAPSTGKSTLTEYMARQHATVWMPEFGREFWETHQLDRKLTLEQLVEIADSHRRREDELILNANQYFFVDTDATTTHQFSLDYHGAAHPKLSQFADACLQRYGLFMLCQPDIPYHDTWDRSGAVHRHVFARKVEADLVARKTPFIRLFGSLEERAAKVTRVLASCLSFDSPADSLFAANEEVECCGDVTEHE